MKKYTILIALILAFCSAACSQSSDSTISVNLLSVPVAPAFTILGIEPTSIEEPTTPTDLLVSVKNSTGNFKNFPTDYALSFAPGWVFGGSKINYQSFASGKNVWQNIKQSSIFSIATHTVENKDSTTSTQLGFGIKFSIFRGTVDEEYDNLKAKKDTIYQILSIISREYFENSEELLNKDKNYLDIQAKLKQAIENRDIELIKLYSKRRDYISDTIQNKHLETNYPGNFSEELRLMRSQASKIKFERSGFKLDLGLGLGYDFASQNWENGKLFRYGLWLNGGNVRHLKNKQSFVWLLTSRLLMFPNEEYKKENTVLTANNLRFDFGGRVIYKLPNKLSLSSELLSRTVVNNKDVPHTYRFTFNFDYQLLPNQVLTLSLGRDFDGTISKDGNLIAALNLIMGFGKQRPF